MPAKLQALLYLLLLFSSSSSSSSCWNLKSLNCRRNREHWSWTYSNRESREKVEREIIDDLVLVPFVELLKSLCWEGELTDNEHNTQTENRREIENAREKWEREFFVVVVLLFLLELFKSLILQAGEQGELADHEHNSDREDVSREEKWERQERHVKDVKKMERAREGEQTVLGERLGVEGGRGGGRDQREREEEERERSKR